MKGSILQARNLDRLIKTIFSKKATHTNFSHEELKKIDFISRLRRELKLSNGRTVYLTEKAEEALNEAIEIIIEILDPIREFDNNDIYKTCKQITAEIHSNEPEKINTEFFIELTLEKLKPQIKEHFFAVTITGLELQKLEAYEIENLIIRKADRTILDECKSNQETIEHVWKRMQGRTWLTGVVRGSQNYAQQIFFEHSKKFSSVIAIAVASVSEWGASDTRIEPSIEGSHSGGPVTWFSYPTDSQSIQASWTWGRLNPTIVTKDILDDLCKESDWFTPLLALLLNPPKTEIDSAIHRAAYWFYDAQADQANEMRLVKFWSCIECFFSFEKTKITSSIIDGLSLTLVYGGYHFIKPEKENFLRKRIEELYELRSQAVHDARHEHTTQRDVADVSQWAAWLIMTMLKLTESGYETRAQIKKETDRLGATYKKAQTKEGLLNKKNSINTKLKALNAELITINDALNNLD